VAGAVGGDRLSEEDGEAKVGDKADPEMEATRGLAVRHARDYRHSGVPHACASRPP
jgi:hypothetical protein